mmetsp:Transcript_55813/g.154528  ORF Transcript_55813/g.154528 Transcript_55813/m.154528 type:complete len:249 (+) Transcript_55813:898-1644(+)
MRETLASFGEEETRVRGTMSSSRKTLHLAVESSALLPVGLRQLPQMSNSSSSEFAARAVARASAPTSPIALSRRESLLSWEALPSIVAKALAPASLIPLSPRQSSRMAPRPGTTSAWATACAPVSPRPRPLSSSSGRSGGAQRHSRPRAALHTAHMRTRSANVGSRSRKLCSSSGIRSCRRRPVRGAAKVVAAFSTGTVSVVLGDRVTTQVQTGGNTFQYWSWLGTGLLGSSLRAGLRATREAAAGTP